MFETGASGMLGEGTASSFHPSYPGELTILDGIHVDMQHLKSGEVKLVPCHVSLKPANSYQSRNLDVSVSAYR